MSRTIPIIQLEDNLIVSIQVELSDHLVQELKDNIAAEISKRNVKGLVIEVSGVDVLDTFIARAIRNIAQLARLMGVHTILAGLDAGMAITLVEMDMRMDGVGAAMNLHAALEALRQSRRTEDVKIDELLDRPSDTEADKHWEADE